MNHAEREVLRGSKDGVLARKDLFPETQYGIVKRIQVIEEWVHAVKERMGKPLLAILNYGCGTGDHITFPLAQAENEVLGIDVHSRSTSEIRFTQPFLSGRRPRTFFCGPYADAVFRIFPERQTLFRLNNRLADVSPFSWAADWMFLLEQKENAHP